MSEPNPLYWKSISSTFLKSYNLRYNTTYNWSNDRLASEPSDFECIDSQRNILEIQYTEAVGTRDDLLKQKVRPQITNRIIRLLQIQFERYSIKNIYCSINFHNPPQDSKEQESLVYWLAYSVAHYQTKGKDKHLYFSYDAEDYENYIEPISKWVSSISIESQRQKKPILSFSSTEYPLQPKGTLDPTQRFENAVSKKINHYAPKAVKNLVLLVDFKDLPWSESEIQFIKEMAKSMNPSFKSIWIIKPWLPEEAVEVFTTLN